jgi:hypothetical protein
MIKYLSHIVSKLDEMLEIATKVKVHNLRDGSITLEQGEHHIQYDLENGHAIDFHTPPLKQTACGFVISSEGE